MCQTCQSGRSAKHARRKRIAVISILFALWLSVGITILAAASPVWLIAAVLVANAPVSALVGTALAREMYDQ